MADRLVTSFSKTTWALIGRVGSSGPGFFEIGSSKSYHHDGQPGRLFLRTNDNNPGNGSGAFFVSITITRQPVRFYVYAPRGTCNGQVNNDPSPDGDALACAAALDKEGPKSMPQMCMACHGGTYNLPAAHEVSGASFLPFDVFSFLYSQKPGLGQNDQEEQFRLLNLLVKNTNPNPDNTNQPIHKLIDAFYDNKVEIANTKAVVPKPPPSWQAHTALYQNFFGRYCRTCHVAVNNALDYYDFEVFRTSTSASETCGGVMPHAQVPYTALAGARLDSATGNELIALGYSCLLADFREELQALIDQFGNELAS